MATTTAWLELELEVDYDYSPGREARMPSPQCETGEPPEGEEFEITNVVLNMIGQPQSGAYLLPYMTDKELANIEQQIRDEWPTDADGDY